MTAAAFDPWIWVALAVGLSILEMLLPGYVLLGFGAAAALVAGGLAMLPITDAPTLQNLFVLLILWAALALAVWFALSRVFGAKARSRRAKGDINDFESSG